MVLIRPRFPYTGHSFQAAAPVGSHWRVATCEEFGCPAHELGFKIVLKVPEQQNLVDMVRRLPHGRRYKEVVEEAGFVEFVFPPGQQCFRRHLVGVGKQPIMTHSVLGGEARRFQEPSEFHEDMNETAERIQQHRKEV